MSPLLTEDLISITEAAGELGAQMIGRAPVRSTIWRWTRYGAHGRRLESVAIGGRLYTSRQAIARFIAR